jgi:hypothetical protein
MKRLVAVGLALVLSLGLCPTARADIPVVVPDPVSIPVVVPDPVVAWPYWVPPIFTNLPVVPTGGSGLTGTYAGTSPSVRYIPAFQYQLLPTDPQGGFSCTAYAMAMAVDKSTYGGSRVTGRQIRALSTASAYVGLTLPQAIAAASRLYVPVTNESGSGTWVDLLNALKHGRGVVLQGDYDQIPDNYSGQPTFDGNHAVYIDYIHSTGLYMYVMDPLQRNGAQWVPVTIMQKFAEKLARTTGIYPRLFYAVTVTTRLLH